MQSAHTYIPSVELALRYGLTNDHVASLCRKGKLVAARAGKLWMVDEASLKSYLSRVRREREERRRSLSLRFKRELRERSRKSALSVETPLGASLEWAFAVVLFVALSSGLARAGDISALSPASQLLAPAASASAHDALALSAAALASAKEAVALSSASEPRPPESGFARAAQANIEDVLRGADAVAEFATEALAINFEYTAGGARAAAAVFGHFPESYRESAAVFVDATFCTGARAFVAAVELWGEGMSGGYAAAGEAIVSGALLAGATFEASAGGELSATIAVANIPGL